MHRPQPIFDAHHLDKWLQKYQIQWWSILMMMRGEDAIQIVSQEQPRLPTQIPAIWMHSYLTDWWWFGAAYMTISCTSSLLHAIRCFCCSNNSQQIFLILVLFFSCSLTRLVIVFFCQTLSADAIRNKRWVAKIIGTGHWLPDCILIAVVFPLLPLLCCSSPAFSPLCCCDLRVDLCPEKSMVNLLMVFKYEWSPYFTRIRA